jgi:hypothetical protein
VNCPQHGALADDGAGAGLCKLSSYLPVALGFRCIVVDVHPVSKKKIKIS